MIGFLHTSPVHVETFRGLMRTLAPGVGDLHVVDESLLADARAGRDVSERLLSRLRSLSAADVIVCTCSTLSGVAASRGVAVGVRVLRVDEPMARAAVAAGRRIGVVVAVQSSLAPTLALLESVSLPSTVLVPALCLDAWPLFAAGDLRAYAVRVAEHARSLDVDVVVLAQASMAPAADLLADLGKPVLTSPRPAVERALALVA